MIGTEQERLAALDALYPVWEPTTLSQRLSQCAQRFGDQEFIALEDASYTYSDVLAKSEELAKALCALGVRKDDRFIVLLPNCPEFLFLTFALSLLGAVKVPVHCGVTPSVLRYILQKTGARWLCAQDIVSPTVFDACPQLQKAIVTEKNKLYTAENILYWPDLLELGREMPVPDFSAICAQAQDPTALSDILFTSGSTGTPKGVMLTQDMLLRSAFGTCRSRCFETGRRIYAPCPLFHAYTYVEGLLAVMLVGGTLLMSRLHFSADTALHLLRDLRANDMLLLGSMMAKLLHSGKVHAEDFPNLHAIYYATATPDWIWDATRDAFSITDLSTGMGMTELCACGVLTRPSTPPDYVRLYDGLPKDAGCAGDPSLNGQLLEILICDPETGQELPPETEGEIYYRGPAVTPGYYKDSAATQKAFTADGWFKSGDLGTLSRDGYLTFRGRCNDMFKVNGENVSPLYLDSVIGQCPAVYAVETVGARLPSFKEVGVAFIVPAGPDMEGEIQRYCQKTLSRFQMPYAFFYSDGEDWPRTETGKISKKLLRTIAEEKLSMLPPKLPKC